MTNEYRKTLCDIDLIINELDEKQKNRIPSKLRNLIKENKLENYKSEIDTKVPLEEQTLTEDTKAFLAMLYINYWCNDETEKQEMINKLSENEKIYQQQLSEKYSYENLFKNRTKTVEQKVEDSIKEENSEVNSLVQYKEPMIKRILNKIFSFFRRR